MMQTLRGLPASPGLAIGPCVVLEKPAPTGFQKPAGAPEEEWQRLEHARARTRARLEEMQALAEARAGTAEADIFLAQALMLDDPDLLGQIRQRLERENQDAATACRAAFEAYARQVESLPDEYLRARAADLRDVGSQVIAALQGDPEKPPIDLPGPSVILARDLTPSDTIQLNPELVLAFCTAEGGPTSHTAILAKAMKIPAVVGVGPELLSIPAATQVLVDGELGTISVDPEQAAIREFLHRRDRWLGLREQEQSQAQAPAITLDGKRVEVAANIGRVEDAAQALDQGAEAIGLLRTEFLYLDRDRAPSEEEQTTAYRSILKAMGSRPVVMRTLDVGGDKPLPYLPVDPEANPFLGWRAIRLCLDQPEFFKVQLRAIWRASPGYPVRLMFPMIATLQEVRRAKALLEEARQEVQAASHPAEAIPVGIMVEIPAVVALADQFAREVDFFSIGTNDLAQYTFAAERNNPRVARLGDPCHPAILRSIQRVIQAGHQAGIWVGVCGEMAGDPEAIPILFGLDLDEFSMAPAAIPRAKAVLRTWSQAAARELAREVLDLDSAESVREKVRLSAPQ